MHGDFVVPSAVDYLHVICRDILIPWMVTFTELPECLVENMPKSCVIIEYAWSGRVYIDVGRISEGESYYCLIRDSAMCDLLMRYSIFVLGMLTQLRLLKNSHAEAFFPDFFDVPRTEPFYSPEQLRDHLGKSLQDFVVEYGLGDFF
ncbi:hypothetical protein M2D07_015835 [Pseudomonas sp. BGr12]|uniref:hypothetical protein n=1 Tax=Pseudomonas sp. BGr12 TaxID=2936269 RepID=UPI002559C693|nr:hypothetical protein [Pseudomonas sp. BJa5]MDL2428490.1 hypothetical protein [Pseudomonas sp. BJa5]